MNIEIRKQASPMGTIDTHGANLLIPDILHVTHLL
jgi:hypothetical protein